MFYQEIYIAHTKIPDTGTNLRYYDERYKILVSGPIFRFSIRNFDILIVCFEARLPRHSSYIAFWFFFFIFRVYSVKISAGFSSKMHQTPYQLNLF